MIGEGLMLVTEDDSESYEHAVAIGKDGYIVACMPRLCCPRYRGQ